MATKPREKIFTEAASVAFGKLSQTEQENIDRLVGLLCDQVRTLGPLGALELLAKIGVFECGKSKEMASFLQIVESEE